MNGEGIAYAIETGEIAAELIHEALVKDRPGLAMVYPQALARALRRATSTSAVASRRSSASPRSWVAATKYLLPNPKVMGFAMRMMANLTDGRDGDAQDKLFYLLERLARAS